MSLKQQLRATTARGLERRDAGGSEPTMSEVRSLVEGISRTFAEFRSQNDNRLTQIEQRGSADVITSETVDRVNAEITRLTNELTAVQTRLNRPGAAGGSANGETPAQAEYRQNWNGWARRGRHSDEAMLEMERRANTTLVQQDGGILVPLNVDTNILNTLTEESVVRTLFNALPIGTGTYSRLANLHGAGAGWVGETDARPATNGPQFGAQTGVFGEIYANPQVSQTLLDDNVVDLEALMAAEIATAIANVEGPAYLFGDGVKKPKGLFMQPTTTDPDKTRSAGTFQVIYTGNATGLQANAAATDNLLDVVYSVKAAFRQNAQWAMARTTLAAVRKLKDGQGNYLWQPSSQQGEPATLLSYPVADIEDMQALGTAGNIPIAFGNFQRAYQILDRMGIRTLRDPYTNKPYVGFYTTKRVGGVVLDSQAVKFVKIGTGS